MTAAIVLAAGLSRRFGAADKLLHPLGSRPMAGHVAALLSRLPLAQKIAVVSSDRVAELFAAEGFELVRNSAPEAGLGHSLQLGRATLQGADRALICLGDMPFVSEAHLRRVLQGSADGALTASRAGNYIGPPVVASAARLRAATLAGDAGLRELLRGARLIEAPAAELRDIDLPEEL